MKPIFPLLAVLVLGVGCDKAKVVDPWDLALAAYEAKNRADTVAAIQQIPAGVYALKLAADCPSDPAKCEKALRVLEFAAVIAEGESSDAAHLYCKANQALVLTYLFQIRMDLQMRAGILEDQAKADESYTTLKTVWGLEDKVVKQCDRYKQRGEQKPV